MHYPPSIILTICIICGQTRIVHILIISPLEAGSWLFIANDTDRVQEVAAAGHDLVGEADVERVRLEPGAVAVLREP